MKEKLTKKHLINIKLFNWDTLNGMMKAIAQFFWTKLVNLHAGKFEIAQEKLTINMMPSFSSCLDF